MSAVTCPSCNTPAPAGAVFCDNCGYDLRNVAPVAPSPPPQAAAGETCPSCGHSNVTGAAFCENCGAQLNIMPSTATPPAQQPVQPAAAPQPETPAQPAAQPEAPAPAPPTPQPVTPLTSVAGRLVIQGPNVNLPIPGGRQTIVIGREDPVSGIFPDIDLDPYGGQEEGVGRQHAQLILQGGQIHVEDLDSVNGTLVNKQKLPPREPTPIKDGDELRFGKMVLIYHAS